jgi:plastocyanin
MRRLLACTVLAAVIFTLPATALAAKPVPVTLSGELFDNKPNVKLTIKLGGSLRFTWKDGFHNVLTQKAPAKANRVSSGAPTATHEPLTFKPAKKGTYVFYCLPHRALGMVLTLKVT